MYKQAVTSPLRKATGFSGGLPGAAVEEMRDYRMLMTSVGTTTAFPETMRGQPQTQGRSAEG